MNFYSSRHLTRSLYVVPALFLLLVLSACSLVEEPDQKKTEEMTISFRILTGKTSLTRAVDFYGNAAENYIDLSNFKIMIFDENQKLKQLLYNNGTPADDTKLNQLGPGFYQITTKLDKDLYSKASKFAIVAIANWESKNPSLITDFKGHTIDQDEIGILSINDLKKMTFNINPIKEGETQTNAWIPGDGSWIPMFGSTFVSLEAYDHEIYNEGYPMPLPDVNLIRALTKIEIINTDLGGPEIKYIHLVHRNRKGYLVQDYDFQSRTGNVSSPTIPDDAEYTQNALPFSFNKTTNTYSVYIPEMLFGDVLMRMAIRVNIDMNGEEKSKWIYLAPYKDGQPIIQSDYNLDWQNIKRNYYYQYVINNLAFEFAIEVNPWIFGGKVHIDSNDIEEMRD